MWVETILRKGRSANRFSGHKKEEVKSWGVFNISYSHHLYVLALSYIKKLEIIKYELYWTLLMFYNDTVLFVRLKVVFNLIKVPFQINFSVSLPWFPYVLCFI